MAVTRELCGERPFGHLGRGSGAEPQRDSRVKEVVGRQGGVWG